MKKRLLAILCAVALLLPMAALPTVAATVNWTAESYWTDYELTNTPDYSFAVIGDIQAITEHDVDNGHHYTQVLFDWILNNKASRNIQYVFGLGDSINTITSYPEENYSTSTHNPAEWKIAGDQYARFKGKIPYLAVRGNHDDVEGYHKAICTTDYQNQMTGFFYDPSNPSASGNSMSNSYRKITIGNEKYLMLGLDYNIYNNAAVRSWANEVIAANPDHIVIVTLHAYYNSFGGMLNGNVGKPGTDKTDGEEWIDLEYFSATQLWNEIFSQHANIAAILCGHAEVDQPIIKTHTGKNGNDVLEILVNPQKADFDRQLDGIRRCGFVFMINVSNGGKTLEFEYISTVRERYTADYYNNSTKFHLKSFQSSSSVIKSVDVTLKPTLVSTQNTASTRISATNSGLRFKTQVSKETLNELVTKYGKSNVMVGTLIAPADKLGATELTHAFGTAGVNYIDVVANIDSPFASGNDTLTYAGTISNIKRANLGRDFVGRGYVAYRTSTNSAWVYTYSSSASTRSIDYVATAAMNDAKANYSMDALAILEQLTVQYWDGLVKDPFGKDPF